MQNTYEFIQYVCKFYCNEKFYLNGQWQFGIEPIASMNDICYAVMIFIQNTPIDEIAFDSIDRERIRKIIEPAQ